MKESKQFSIAEILSVGFTHFFNTIIPILKLAGAIIGIYLLLLILAGPTVLISILSFNLPALILGSALISLLILTIPTVIYLKGMLQIHDQKKIQWNQLLSAVNWPRAFMGILLFSLAAFLCSLFLIIPGYIFITRYYFFPYLLMDNYSSIEECFHEAARMSEGIRWKLCGLFIIQSILGSFILIFPALTLANIFLYRKIQGKSQETNNEKS